MSETNNAKKIRKANFQASEINILVEEVSRHQNELFGPFSAVLTAKVKGKLWQGIAEKINAVCATSRGAVEVRKKWNDYKCYVKKRSMSLKKEQKMTGGGTAPPNLTAIEEKVLSMIPACQIDGVEGGVELGFIEESIESGSSAASSSVTSASSSSPSITATTATTVPTATTISPSTETPSTSAAKDVKIISKGPTAEVFTVKEAKTKGKRKLEFHKEDPLTKMVAVEEEKLKKLEELTTVWKDFFQCTKAYQERDLAIKERLLELKEKELNPISDYSVSPTIKFLNEF